MTDYQSIFDEQAAIAYGIASNLKQTDLSSLKTIATPPAVVRDIFAMLGPIFNSTSYTSSDWKDTQIHLSNPNIKNILQNMNYESVATNQYEKVRALHDKMSTSTYEKSDSEIHKTARDFWTYATAWLQAVEAQLIMKQMKDDDDFRQIEDETQKIEEWTHTQPRKESLEREQLEVTETVDDRQYRQVQESKLFDVSVQDDFIRNKSISPQNVTKVVSTKKNKKAVESFEKLNSSFTAAQSQNWNQNHHASPKVSNLRFDPQVNGSQKAFLNSVSEVKTQKPRKKSTQNGYIDKVFKKSVQKAKVLHQFDASPSRIDSAQHTFYNSVSEVRSEIPKNKSRIDKYYDKVIQRGVDEEDTFSVQQEAQSVSQTEYLSPDTKKNRFFTSVQTLPRTNDKLASFSNPYLQSSVKKVKVSNDFQQRAIEKIENKEIVMRESIVRSETSSPPRSIHSKSFAIEAQKQRLLELQRNQVVERLRIEEVQRAYNIQIEEQRAMEIERSRQEQVQQAYILELEEQKVQEMERMRIEEEEQAYLFQIEQQRSAEVERIRIEEKQRAYQIQFEQKRAQEMDRLRIEKEELAYQLELEQLRNYENEKQRIEEEELAYQLQLEEQKTQEIEMLRIQEEEKAYQLQLEQQKYQEIERLRIEEEEQANLLILEEQRNFEIERLRIEEEEAAYQFQLEEEKTQGLERLRIEEVKRAYQLQLEEQYAAEQQRLLIEEVQQSNTLKLQEEKTLGMERVRIELELKSQNLQVEEQQAQESERLRIEQVQRTFSLQLEEQKIQGIERLRTQQAEKAYKLQLEEQQAMATEKLRIERVQQSYELQLVSQKAAEIERVRIEQVQKSYILQLVDQKAAEIERIRVQEEEQSYKLVLQEQEFQEREKLRIQQEQQELQLLIEKEKFEELERLRIAEEEQAYQLLIAQQRAKEAERYRIEQVQEAYKLKYELIQSKAIELKKQQELLDQENLVVMEQQRVEDQADQARLDDLTQTLLQEEIKNKEVSIQRQEDVLLQEEMSNNAIELKMQEEVRFQEETRNRSIQLRMQEEMRFQEETRIRSNSLKRREEERLLEYTRARSISLKRQEEARRLQAETRSREISFQMQEDLKEQTRLNKERQLKIIYADQQSLLRKENLLLAKEVQTAEKEVLLKERQVEFINMYTQEEERLEVESVMGIDNQLDTRAEEIYEKFVEAQLTNLIKQHYQARTFKEAEKQAKKQKRGRQESQKTRPRSNSGLKSFFGKVFKGFDKSLGSIDLESDKGKKFLTDCFNEFDTNGDKKLQPEEIYGALKKADKKASYGLIFRIMREVDDDDDGEIDFNEFKTLVDHLQKGTFDDYDSDDENKLFMSKQNDKVVQEEEIEQIQQVRVENPAQQMISAQERLMLQEFRNKQQLRDIKAVVPQNLLNVQERVILQETYIPKPLGHAERMIQIRAQIEADKLQLQNLTMSRQISLDRRTRGQGGSVQLGSDMGYQSDGLDNQSLQDDGWNFSPKKSGKRGADEIDLDVEEDVLEQIKVQIAAGNDDQLINGNFAKLTLTMNNNSTHAITNTKFDPNDIIENFMQEHPKLNDQYHFNGLWKPEANGQSIMVMLSQKVQEKWQSLGKV